MITEKDLTATRNFLDRREYKKLKEIVARGQAGEELSIDEREILLQTIYLLRKFREDVDWQKAQKKFNRDKKVTIGLALCFSIFFIVMLPLTLFIYEPALPILKWGTVTFSTIILFYMIYVKEYLVGNNWSRLSLFTKTGWWLGFIVNLVITVKNFFTLLGL